MTSVQRRWILQMALYLMVVVMLPGCFGRRETTFSGTTMGTTYHIKIVTGYFKITSGLKDRIDKRLFEINQSMSTYIPDSEISRFNGLQSTEEKFYISEDFMRVLQVGRLLYDLSGGAWDGTVKPLVDLWGFSQREPPKKIPAEETIAGVLSQVGFRHIEVSDEGYIRKKKVPLALDLASVAKGYGVDEIASLLQSRGIHDFMVEIGGEVYAAGVRKDKNRWRIGVNLPQKGAGLDAVYDIVELEDSAMATSGDYRNFYEINGKTFSHILDPRSGIPVSHDAVSVSIVARTCVYADGLATAVLVLGRDEGLSLVEKLTGVEALIITRSPKNELRAYASSGFQRGTRRP